MKVFKLTDSVLEQYRSLRYSSEARREFNFIPLRAFVWEDEHPGGECHIPLELDEESMISMVQLAVARTELWISGQVPSHYAVLWEEARTALPEWPGFARLSLSAEELEEMQELGEMTDDFHAAFNAEVGEHVEIEVAPGIFQVVGTKDLSQLDTDESEPDD